MNIDKSKFYVMLDTNHFDEKPNQKQVSAIQNRIMKFPVELSKSEFQSVILNGQSFICANLFGSKTPTNNSWKKQNVIALDIDGMCTIEEFMSLSKSINLNPSFIYTTFSHSEEEHRFRAIYLLDKYIETFEEREKIYNIFVNLFKINDESILDVKCVNPSRLFYGGQSIIHDSNNIFNVNDLLENHKDLTIVKKENKIKSEAKNEYKFDLQLSNEVINQIKENRFSMLNREEFLMDINFDLTNRIKNCKKLRISKLFKLPVNKSFNCILHDDKNPSASIFIDDAGHERYYCFSNCRNEADNKGYDIIDLIMIIKNNSLLETLSYIENICNMPRVLLDKNNFDLNANIKILNTLNKSDKIYNYLKLSRSLDFLKYFLEIADSFYSEGRFFCSLRKIKSLLKEIFDYSISLSSLCNKINDLTELGFITKIKYRDLPEDIRIIQLEKSFEKGYKYSVSYFSIPQYTKELFENAISIINKRRSIGVKKMFNNLYESKLNVSGFEKANQINVQNRRKDIKEKTKKFNSSLLNLVIKQLIAKKYITMKEISNIVGEYNCQISLPLIISILGLKKVRVNNSIKQKYDLLNINSNSFIYVITSKTMQKYIDIISIDSIDNPYNNSEVSVLKSHYNIGICFTDAS